MEQQLVTAAKAFGYGGLQLERGELFKAQGLANDGALRSRGYMVSFAGEPVQCGLCGKRFADAGARRMHAAAQHADVYGSRPPWKIEAELTLRRNELAEVERHLAIRKEQSAEADATVKRQGIATTDKDKERFAAERLKANELRARIAVDRDQMKQLDAAIEQLEAELTEVRANDPVTQPWKGE